MTKKIPIICAAAALGASVAYAAVQLRLSLDEISQSADLIFIGTVQSQSSRYTDARTAIQTDVIFRDIREVHSTEKSRQRGAATITLSHAGGRVGNTDMQVSDAPTFAPGKRYLVFMSDDGPTYLNPVVGGDQGLFEVITDPVTGQAYVLTAHGRAVLGVGSDGNVQSSVRRVLAIQAGIMSVAAEAQAAGPQAEQLPQAVTPGAVAEPATEPATALAGQSPVTEDGFIEIITSVSLKKPIPAPRLKREGTGVFFRAVDGNIVVEPLKTSAPPERSFPLLETRNAPSIEEGVPGVMLKPSAAADDRPGVQGQSLFYCGTRGRPFNMEQVSTAWWEWSVNNNSMWMWNQWVDLYRYIPDDGSYGANGVSEFAGYPAGSFHGFAWNGSLAMTVTWTTGGQCGTITESDVAWNPAYSWTNNFFVAFNGTAINQLPVTGHELGHTHGLQRGNEQYNYDFVSIMHAYYSTVVEDGWGIHASDAINTRANYGSSTGIVDMGVESYWASNGLNNSWTNSTFFRPGNTIIVNNVTVENTSQFTASNVNIRLYLSTNQTISTGDRLIGDWTWGTFCGNCQNVGTYTTSIPTNTPPGTYWVGAIMTINNYGGDSFAFNDTTFFPTPITVSCSGTFSVSPTSRSVLRGGAYSSVGVNTTGSACPWSSSVSDSSWIQITGGSSGTGNGTISYTIAANTGAARSGWISAGGVFHSITQEAGCFVTAAPAIGTWTARAGTLTGSDCLAQRRSFAGSTRPYADRYSFSGAAGERVALWLTSANFDTYVSLISPSDTLLMQDNNGGGGVNSRIPALSGVYTLPAAGVYTVEVTSSGLGAVGSYSLTKMSSILLTVTPDPVTGGCKVAKGRVTLGADAPAGGLVVNLSETLANASAPATLTIPAGVTTRVFNINSTPVAANQSGNVAAAWGGTYGVSGTDGLTLRPISALSVNLTPNPVRGGNPVSGVVTLECAAGPGNVTVNLSSSKPAVAAPAVSSIVIPAGSSSGSFGVNTSAVSVQSSAVIKATANARFKTKKLVVDP